MTRRAFDTRGNLADQLFRCLETPYSDVLKHNTVPATKSQWPSEETPGPFMVWGATVGRAIAATLEM